MYARGTWDLLNCETVPKENGRQEKHSAEMASSGRIGDFSMERRDVATVAIRCH